jgi:hypothetical protein
MAISVVQKAKNFSAYQVKPLTVTLPAGTTAGSYLAVVVEASKSGAPFNLGSFGAHIPNPIVTDDKSNVYTTVDSIVGVSQEANGINNPDASGFFPSAYIYVVAAATGTQNISIGAFYPDEYISPIQPGGNLASPPNVNGRPVFDGGLHAQVFEVAGLATGVDVHGHGTTYGSTPLGAGLFTTSAVAGIIIEAGILIDSATISPDTNVNSVLQYSQRLNASTFMVQTRITGGAVTNAGFGNALKYGGAVVGVALK